MNVDDNFILYIKIILYLDIFCGYYYKNYMAVKYSIWILLLKRIYKIMKASYY